MILYFSATGNCKYVSSRIASATGQEAVSIVDCIQQGDTVIVLTSQKGLRDIRDILRK